MCINLRSRVGRVERSDTQHAIINPEYCALEKIKRGEDPNA